WITLYWKRHRGYGDVELHARSFLSHMSTAASFTPSGTVLLVEDDHDIRVSLRALLEGEGYNVLTATSGRSALDALQSTTPTPRLIILDLRLPVMDGWDFVAHVRRVPELAPIPLVVMSAARTR